MVIHGNRVSLIPLQPQEREQFYTLITQTEGTAFWYGVRYNDTVPTADVLFDDFKEYYFDGSKPLDGRCFWILVDDEKVGQINYNAIDVVEGLVELDIFIGHKEHMDKGFGSEAIQLLCNYLFENLHVKQCFLLTLNENPRAVKACEKAGLQKFRRIHRDGLEWQEMIINRPG